MIVSKRITQRKRKRGGLRMMFVFASTTVMVATGGFGVVPENSFTQGLQQAIGENIPVGFLQPFNSYMEALSAPTIQPDPAPVSKADSPFDPIGTIVALFPTQGAGTPTLSQETAVYGTAFAILAETQTQIAATLTAGASITPTQTVTLTSLPTASPTFTPTSTPTPAPIFVYPIINTRTPRPPNPSAGTTTTIPPIVLYAGNSSDGNIGPRASADALCASNLPSGYNSFRAFIAYSAADTLSNMPANYSIPKNAEIKTPNGSFLATDWTDLMDGSIEQDLNSAGLGGLSWWSGVEDEFGNHTDGVSADCNEWTSNSIADGGNYGNMATFDGTWMDSLNSAACDQSLTILCIAY